MPQLAHGPNPQVANTLPAITGKQLIKLLRRDGWELVRKANHGLALAKMGPDGRTHVTVVPDKRSPLPDGTLADILGPLQTQIGRHRLADLIERFGLK